MVFVKWAKILVSLSCIVSAICSIVGCSSIRLSSNEHKGVVVISNPQFKSYARFAVAANNHTMTALSFPLLQIYDANGQLVYFGDNALTNSQFLDHFTGNLTGLKPISGSLALSDAMKGLPEPNVARSRC